MKHRNKIVSIIATVMLLACFAAIPVMAQVPTPCAFSGSVTLDGAVSPGSIITVKLADGTPVVTTPAVVTVTAGSQYGVVIPQEIGTGKPAQGDTLNFYVDGFLGGSDTWAAGGIKTLNLAATSAPAVVTYTLTTTVSPAGTGSVAKSPDLAQYPAGTVVTLTATASAGYQFSHWSGDAAGTSATTTVTMNANKAVTANFVQMPPQEAFANWLAAFIAALRA